MEGAAELATCHAGEALPERGEGYVVTLHTSSNCGLGSVNQDGKEVGKRRRSKLRERAPRAKRQKKE